MMLIKLLHLTKKTLRVCSFHISR